MAVSFDRAAFIAEYESGARIVTLCKLYGCSKNTAYRIIKANREGTRMPDRATAQEGQRKVKTEQVDELLQAYREGVPIDLMCDRFKCSQATVYKHLRKAQVSLRSTGRASVASVKKTESVKKPQYEPRPQMLKRNPFDRPLSSKYDKASPAAEIRLQGLNDEAKAFYAKVREHETMRPAKVKISRVDPAYINGVYRPLIGDPDGMKAGRANRRAPLRTKTLFPPLPGEEGYVYGDS